MGSKKLKRKKLKCKKVQKVRKSKNLKRKRNVCLESDKEIDSELTSPGSYSRDNRLNLRKYSRSYIGDKSITKLKNFCQIREDYFSYLQTVIKDNCVYYDCLLTDEMLEKLSLELEQYALLACLQVDIYEKSMTKIINDIKKCTEDKQIHEEVKKLLPDKPTHQNQMKTEKETNSQEHETYFRIPTISSTRTDVHINGHDWREESVYNDTDFPNQCGNFVESEEWNNRENYSSSYWNDEVPEANESNLIYQNSNIVTDSVAPQTENSFSDRNGDTEIINKSEILDPLLISRNQLQKSVEQTLSQCERVNRQRKDEKERAYIAHILEGDDSLEDKFNDSLSDNENESKENVDESNLLDRLEKMREIFGVEEEENPVVEKGKPQNVKINSRSKKPTIWRHEKIIHLHKFSMLASEMSYERRLRNRRLFLELFGEDSDEEHEGEYRCEERYRASCTERISSWVVKHLMPFYHEKRIVGRNVFKSLGHHISDSIIDEIQYPDEWTVKYFVSKFFPPRKKYLSDADVLAFQLE